MNFSAVILAGGKSSRMGCDKAMLQFNGRPLLARQVELAREIGAAEVFISGRAGADHAAFGCRVLLDRFAGAGPLAGIECALAAVSTPLLLVLAVDMPAMNAEFLRRLVARCDGERGAIPRVNGYIEPLAAIYPKASQAFAASQLQRGFFAAKDFAAGCGQSNLARLIDLPPGDAHRFANWNSPADLASTGTRGPGSLPFVASHPGE